jgi:hypothetical protein
MNRRTHANESSQGMDGREPLIPCGATAMAVPFQVIKKLPHDRRRQIFHGHSIDSLTIFGADERQKQHQRVTITSLGVP